MPSSRRVLLRHKISETHTWGCLRCRRARQSCLSKKKIIKENKENRFLSMRANCPIRQSMLVWTAWAWKDIDRVMTGVAHCPCAGGAVSRAWTRVDEKVGHGAQDAGRAPSSICRLQMEPMVQKQKQTDAADQTERAAVIGLSDSMAWHGKLGSLASSWLEALSAGGRFRQIGTGPKLDAETDRTRVIGVARVGG